MTSLTIRELPRTDRPRERLVDLGAHALSTAELLAIVLGTGARGRSALGLGHDILTAAQGSLRRLATQPVATLTEHSGVGRARAAVIHAALELGRRLAAESHDEGVPIRSPRDVVAVFAPRLEDLPVEEFHVDVTVTRGILNSSLVHPREVFREAIAERAAALILVHNHPSGDPTPSADDRNVTDQLVAAGRLLDIPVHDHVIIGRGRYTSFAEAGLL
jgi:DNA repair protein RadC